MPYLSKLTLITLLLFSLPAKAEFEWVSFTLDNDLFIGDDGGYTNGIYLALNDTEKKGSQPTPSWMLTPLLWSLSVDGATTTMNTYTIGQKIVTPQDISVAVPSEDDVPYAGLLYVNNTFLTGNKHYADKIGTTLGLVGPLSLAEQSQKFVHQIIDATEPKGWDTQLKNEFVFQFDRARAWRSWASDNQNWDLITMAEVSVGTLSSSVNTGVMLRYGTNLLQSYAKTLLVNTITTNPTSINGDWNIYAGINAGYQFNQIFMDGNTFQDSRSIDYQHESIGATLGFSYSWDDYSIAFSVNNLNIISDKAKSQPENLAQFGTLTFAVKL